MVNSWWLVAEACVFFVLIFYLNRVNYRCGIWDGAFNHFLPVVQKEMLLYDEHRARKILDAEAAVFALARAGE